jgi:hypothetical protein
MGLPLSEIGINNIIRSTRLWAVRSSPIAFSRRATSRSRGEPSGELL